MTRSNLARAIVALICAAASVDAQPRTRAEQIEDVRDDKIAHLWPERESPLVRRVNGVVERGLGDGLESGKGANGPQIVMGGKRSGQGASFGVGYRRGDLWRERLGYRATVRGTVQLAYMMDFELDFQGLGTKTSFVRLYSKYESSPQMDYYGEGADSSKDSRTSYALDDFSTDLDAGFQLFGEFEAGLTFGRVAVHNGTGSRLRVPSTDEVFTPQTTPVSEWTPISPASAHSSRSIDATRRREREAATSSE